MLEFQSSDKTALRSSCGIVCIFCGGSDLAEMSLEQFLQFARLGHHNNVAFYTQKLLVTKFRQRAREGFARRSHFGGKHTLGSVEFNLNLSCADGPWTLSKQPIGQPRFHIFQGEIEELGNQREIDHIERIMREGTGADRQLLVWEHTRDVKIVVDQIVVETNEGLFV